MTTNLNSNSSEDKASRYYINAELVIPSTAKGSSTATPSITHLSFPVQNPIQATKEGGASTASTSYYDSLQEALLVAKQAINSTLTQHVDDLQTQMTPLESILKNIII